MADNIINLLHLLATSVWIGGMIYIHFILLPALKHIDHHESGKLMGLVAKRFSIAAWSSILVLLITGYLKTPAGLLLDTSSNVGIILTVKHVLIVLVIIVGVTITIRVVPNLRRATPMPGEKPSDEFFRYEKQLHAFATMNLILGLMILLCASIL